MIMQIIGVALTIVVTLILIAVLAKPITRAILGEVRAYHKAEAGDAAELVTKLATAIITAWFTVSSKLEEKNVVKTPLEVLKDTDKDE